LFKFSNIIDNAIASPTMPVINSQSEMYSACVEKDTHIRGGT